MNKHRIVLLAASVALVASAAFAQDESPALRQADGAQAANGEIRVAQLFGESDEEKAARLQHEQNQDTEIANLNDRVGDLESSLRNLTGQVEELDHRLAEMKARMARMQKDYDYKLCTIAAQQLGASTDPDNPNALPCAGGGGQNSAPPSAPAASSISPPSAPAAGPVHLAPPPGVLGTLPANQSSAASPPPIQSAALAGIDTRTQFDGAMKLLSQAQYDEASAQFRTFADAHPQDALAPQAVYWIGDIAYVQKDYANAARAFAEEIKKYPTSERAPLSMLKLGQSLIAMNRKREGCTFLDALHAKYPAAEKTVEEQAHAARRAAGCR
jgi:tol-pal system protein YbgF